MLSQYKFIKNFNESELGKGFFDYLVQLKKEGKRKKELENDPRIKAYSSSLDEYVRSVKFINKEVTIE
jgi:uncharacterized protein YllA (UPF0747 family)